MQFSVINFKDFNDELRIDAEYYRKEVLDRLNILAQHKKDNLDELVDFVIGPFGSTVTTDQYVDKSEHRYVRNQDIDDFIIKSDAPAHVPKAVYDSLPRFHIQENDLLITVVGTLGKVAIATARDANSIFSCKSTIIRTRRDSINPFYLLTYLNSDTGRLFSLRGKRGAIQEGLNLTDLKEIQVFTPLDRFQGAIEKVIKCAFSRMDRAKSLYKEAQTLLLSELGLADWQPRRQTESVRDFSDVWDTGRIDAEYYQPKYDEIVDAIKGYADGWDELGNLVTMRKCVEVGSKEYLDEGIPFVRVSNITPFEITEEKYISAELYSQVAQHQPQQGEILLSKDATPGIAHYLDKRPGKMIPAGGILRLKRKSAKINDEYLTLALNSMLTQEQVNRDVGGSVIMHWRPDQVAGTLIPILPQAKQAEIRRKVMESATLRRQSRELLERAKRAVEMAIEDGEDAAMAWLLAR